MWKQLCLSLAVTLFMQIQPTMAGRRTCGGIFTAARGILTTPNFPDTFDVPIRCQWVIDASNMISANASIIVYLTQLFTFEGLTFTEYQLYGSDYKINPKVIHRVNETNIVRTRWVQTFQSYLVIELKLQAIESSQLRVLDNFLDVFGFNITYEITSNGPRSPSCTMTDCGFTGLCYDHYTKFSCSCFNGYTGPNCSEGPKSFCYTNGTPTCKNGGTCLHVGVAAVKCHCTKLFVGNTCETPVDSTNAKDCPNCPTNCSQDGKLESPCQCLSGKTDTPGQTGLISTLHLGNLPGLPPNDLKNYIKTQLLRYLRANATKTEDLQIMNMVHYMSGADVTFQVYGPKKDEKRVKNVLNKWIDRGYVGNVTVSEKDNSIKTVLSIQSVDINQAGVIRENDEFILSCVARGSPSMTFRWFKDGLFINLTYAKQKWIKLIKDPHVTDQYTALLAVERAQKYDEGKFTCQVEDFNIQQCMSKFVKVKRRPLVKIEPMSLTVKKSQSFTVKCVTMEENGGIGGKYTYSWTKNKELLPVRTEYEKYETLYPAGTILQVFRVEKDVTYSCLVQDSITSSEKVIYVHVLDREGVHTCPNETSYDLIWPETAPDTDYVQECPKDFSGTVVRKCLLRDGRVPAWEKPDFSHCTYKTLSKVYDDFQQLKLGYATTSIDTLSEAFLEYVTITQRGNPRPGEGARILTLIEEVQSFIGQIKMSYATTGNITSRFYKVIDRVCSIPEALLRPQEVNLLQQVLFSQLELSVFQLEDNLGIKFFNVNLNTIDVTVFQQGPKQNIFRVPISIKKIPVETWVSVKITHQTDGKENELFGSIIYRNLSAFFPPKSFLRIKDGTEIQYQIFSQITTLRPISQNRSAGNGEAAVAIDFRHGPDTSTINATSTDNWEVRCGFADAKSLAYSWDIYRCQTKTVDGSVTRCLCPNYGSFVLLLILTQPEAPEAPAEPHKFILICSFCISIILTLVSTVCLGLSFALSKRSCLIVLKIQCSLSLFLYEVLFIVAIVTEPPQQYYMVFLTFLEMFLLLSISSHLSKLLIIFTELIQVSKPMTSKYTVVGIISGVPLITIFGNHLAYKTMDINLKSWWMRENSLAFNIFIVVVSIIAALFIFIYLSVVKKLRELMASQEKHEKAIKRRISLIRRAGCIFFLLIGFSISSIVYINNEKVMWSTYQFGAVNFALGIVVTLCYIVKSEIGIRDIFAKEKRHSDVFFGVDTAGPLQFMTKADAEIENQSVLRKQDIQQLSLKTMESLKVSVSRTQSISNAFESCLQSSSNFCDVSVKDTSTLRRDKTQHQIEPYNSSPPTFRKLQTNNTFSQSPDILSQKVCVELDLVASSICTSNPDIQIVPKETVPKTEKKSEHKTVRIMFPPKVIITPDDAISRILDGDNSDSERTQPDGHDEIIASSEQTNSVCSNTSTPQHTSFPGHNLDGVLDSISHDLDYLLNRSEDVDSGIKTSTLNRKISKPPGANVVHKLPDEILQDESVGPEGIMLRTNC